MRILQVSDLYPPAVGGLETYVESLSRALVEDGHEVMVATLANAYTDRSESNRGVEIRRLDGLPQRIPGAGRDAGHIFHPPVPDPSIMWQLQRLVQTFRPDVIHAHGWMLHSCLLLRRGSASLVAHLHEWGAACVKKSMLTDSGPCTLGPSLGRCTSCAAEQYRGGIRAGLLVAGLRSQRGALCRQVDRFVAVSSAVADVVCEMIPVRERMTVLPSAVADDLAAVAVRTPRPSWLPAGEFLMFAGALAPHKGIDVLLAARRLAKSRLPLVALGAVRHDTPMIDDPEVTVRVDVPHDQVMSSWHNATIGVVPSLVEPFGLVAVECQAAGTPVIVSRTGGLRDIVTDEVSGLVVTPGDPHALAGAIDRLVGDVELRRRLVDAGSARAREFTMAVLLPALYKVYEQGRSTRRTRRDVGTVQ